MLWIYSIHLYKEGGVESHLNNSRFCLFKG